MKIKKISLKNFRNFQKKEVTFFQKNNIVFGQNAVGKTSLLEAIYYSGFTKSPRTSEINDLIKKDEGFFVVTCDFISENRNKKSVLSYSSEGKKIILDLVKIEKVSDYVGTVGVVYYQPNEIVDFLGTSFNRRKTIDSLFSQISQDYMRSLKLFNRILKERNSALKSAKNSNFRQSMILIEMLTEKMVQAMKPIVEYRKVFCDEINNYLAAIHKQFNNQENLKLEYVPNLNVEVLPSINKDVILKDIQNETSSFGIHKDDFVFFVNDKEATRYCSQGQQKSVILSFKLAVTEVFKNHRGEYPVLLLDDALSELDKNRQNALFSVINPEIQMILSTTSLNEINKDFLENAKIIEIKKGEDFDE